MLKIKGSYEAYCLDEATWFLGMWIENELSKVEGKTTKQTHAQQEAKLKALLSSKSKGSSFADPAKLFT